MCERAHLFISSAFGLENLLSCFRIHCRSTKIQLLIYSANERGDGLGGSDGSGIWAIQIKERLLLFNWDALVSQINSGSVI